MSDVPDLGPVPERVSVETAQVRQLIKSQFPRWTDLPIRPVTKGGWDNWTFHLGDALLARLPSAAEYAKAVEKEHRWLPILAPQLPFPIPTPLGHGAPSPDYPHPWSIYQWLHGETATPDRITDPVRFATDLATFLSALQAVDPSKGPQPGVHNWFRGGTLRTFDASTQDALRDLEGRIDVERARDVWTDALSAPWDGVDRWFHGDIGGSNLLLDDAGQLSAVIDFGTCGVGDPACDLAVAWTLLTADGRRTFRERLGADDATWARGRGWALWKAIAICRSTVDDPAHLGEFEDANRVVNLLLNE
ncbi:aminoglycoside phosphotransferase family protein [Sanguibacter sp. 26GB23]|uniref:aminoglycoside phosphotransferase family protein n=1 Tax=Sanguibacter sp. 26GB23 TaxID=3156066 RepID=UPI0032AF6664